MEKTLKERIKDYADDLFSLIDKHKKYEFEIDEFRLIIEETAESFATEQKEIDDKAAFEERGKAFKAGYDTAIDDACEWLYEHAKAYGEADGFDAVYLYDKGMLVRHFRKAMEK